MGNRRIYTRVCKMCHVVMENAAPNRKYCPECYKIHKKAVRPSSQEVYQNDKLRRRMKASEKRDAELRAEAVRFMDSSGSYGKGRLKQILAAQKEEPARVTSTDKLKG